MLHVQPEQPLAIATESLPGALIGGEVLFQLEAVGGLPPYVWSLENDADAVGLLQIDPWTGLLCGVIDAAAPEIDLPLLVRLEDAQLQVTQELVLRCRAGLSIAEMPSDPLYARESFSFDLAAIGGTEPYRWAAAGLPPGIELDPTGLLYGWPTAEGDYMSEIVVQDAEGQVDAVSCLLAVRDPASAAVDRFEALLSRNSVALSWATPAPAADLQVRIVRNPGGVPATTTDGITVYQASVMDDGVCLDREVGAGRHYYAAFLERDGQVLTSAPPATLSVSLPPTADPFAARVVGTELLHPQAYGIEKLPQVALGAPTGRGLSWGSANVLSLGAATNDDEGRTAPYGGAITLEFGGLVLDGPGPDFSVFENVFYIHNAAGIPDPTKRFMEPA
ncbi:MAG: hypothetical protein LC725_01190, partial [Lentisphaerae bacterium]|nr:hypothetical protein [Lentisphaerota bacterium]